MLGTHVEQAGSYQDGERTRFDFSHFAAMTPEELKKVEAIVNEKIAEKIDVRTDVMTVEEAKKTGAMALFGEKYGETVRVVSMGDFSKEFCGGTHVANTGDIVVFKIISESGVAAGVRRIEALTGDNVFAYYKKEEEELEAAAKAAKATPAPPVGPALGQHGVNIVQFTKEFNARTADQLLHAEGGFHLLGLGAEDVAQGRLLQSDALLSVCR